MTMLAPQNNLWFIIIGFKHLSENNISSPRAIIAHPGAILMCCHQLSVAENASLTLPGIYVHK